MKGPPMKRQKNSGFVVLSALALSLAFTIPACGSDDPKEQKDAKEQKDLKDSKEQSGSQEQADLQDQTGTGTGSHPIYDMSRPVYDISGPEDPWRPGIENPLVGTWNRFSESGIWYTFFIAFAADGSYRQYAVTSDNGMSFQGKYRTLGDQILFYNIIGVSKNGDEFREISNPDYIEHFGFDTFANSNESLLLMTSTFSNGQGQLVPWIKTQ